MPETPPFFISLQAEPTGILMAVGVLTVFALSIAILAVVLRFASDRRDDHREACLARWQPVLLDVLAGDQPAEALWALVAPRDHLLFLTFLLRHRFIIEGEARTRLVALGQPFLSSVHPLQDDRDPAQRARALQLLGVFGLECSAEAVLGALQDPAPLVAMTAARALAQSGRRDFSEAVLEGLDRFATWDVSLVASMLALMDAATAVPALLAIYADETRPAATRVAAAEALRWQGSLKAADVAAQVLTTDQDREVLTATLRLLRNVGRPEQAHLVRPLCTSPDFVLRIHAITALAGLGGAGDTALLQEAFDDESNWVAIRAARGLAELGARDVLKDLAVSDHPRAGLARQFV